MNVITLVITNAAPSNLVKKDPLELVPHEAVDDEVVGSIEDEEPVHQAGKAQKPGRRSEVRAPGNTNDEDIANEVNDEV